MYSSSLFSSSLVFITLATVSVILRFYARKSKKMPLLIDDWLILLVLVLAMAYAIAACWGSWKGGLGTQPLNLPPDTAVSYLKLLFFGNLATLVCVAIVKVSILQFYKRIFYSTTFCRAANIMMATVMIWMLIFLFLFLFVKGKPSNNWSLELSLSTSNRFNFSDVLITSVALDIALDITVLCFPLPMVSKLQMSTERKIAVIAVFWLGACCVIASIVRLVYVVQFTGVYYDQTITNRHSAILGNLTIWSQIELCVSIIAACLPPMSSLLESGKWAHRLISKIRSLTPDRSVFSVLQRSKSCAENPDEHSHNLQGRGWEKINSAARPTRRNELELRSLNWKGPDQHRVDFDQIKDIS